MSLRPGDLVEHFVIVSPLGEGGMGQVYLARDTRLQRSVALKILQGELEADPDGPRGSDGAARLMREAQSAAALEHPNVVTIFEVGAIKSGADDVGRPFIAMELVKGKALRAFIGDASIPMKERIRWLVDTARALDAAHKAGLIHRDVKPENVMVREDGVVKVLDFGLAKRSVSGSPSVSSSTEAQVLPSLTGKGIAIGTPYYMAPEQMRREPLDGRADQFAWGVVAYELLSGVPAWGRDVDALELVSKVLSEEPAPLAEVGTGVPAHVGSAVARAMSKRKGARFESMGELIAALEEESAAPSLPRDASRERRPPQGTSQFVEEPARGEPSKGRRTYGVRALALVAIAALLAAGAVAAVRWRAGVVKSAGAPRVACTSHVACVQEHHGEPYVCRASDGQCVAVASQDCTPLYEPRDLTHEDTVWLGTLFPLHGPEAEAYGQMHANAAAMARKEIASATSALDGDGASQRVRRIAMVSCDDSADGLRAAHHLVDDVGVPAILGFKSGQEVVDLAGGYLIKKRVMSVASITASPLITKLPQAGAGPRLVWRSLYSMEGVGRAVATITERFFEPKLRSPSGPMRIVLVRRENTSARALAESLFRALRYNGKSAVENGADYQEVTLRTEEVASKDIVTLARRIALMRPTLVVLALEDGDAGLVDAVEQELAAANERRPTWLRANGSTGAFDGFIGASAERRHRMYSLVSTSESEPNARFVIRYNDDYAQPVSRGTNPASTYDGAYLLAYAAFATGTDAVTGTRLASAIPRLLPPGLGVEVGPEGLLQGLSTLTSDHAVDLRGAGSALDFDVATGEALVDFALRCPGVDDARNARGEVESGVIFHAATGTMDGTARCP